MKPVSSKLICLNKHSIGAMSTRLSIGRTARPVFGPSQSTRCRPVHVKSSGSTTQANARRRAETVDAAPVVPAEDQTRRTALVSLAGVALSTAIDFSSPAEAEAMKEMAQVGTYLPKSDIDGFSLFVPDRSKTPVSLSCDRRKYRCHRVALSAPLSCASMAIGASYGLGSPRHAWFVWHS